MSGKVVEQIKAKLALTDKVGERVKLRRSGKTLLGLCPFHDERTPSFVVYPEEGAYHCFGCQAHGDVIDFVARSRGIEVRDAIAELAREAAIDYRSRDDEQCAPLYAANAEAAALFAAALEQDPDAAACREYVQARGIGADMVRELGLGYAPRQAGALAQALARRDLVEAGIRAGLLRRDRPEEQPRAAFWGRLMFPVRDLDRRVIAFGARALDQRVPKYINSPESVLYSKSRGLYGIDRAAQAIREKQAAIVVEGYVDAIALWQAGIANVVAVCGTALTVYHIKLLRRLAPEIIVTFDGDDAGQAAAARSAETFLAAAAAPAKAVFLPDGHDPDTYVRARGADAFRSLLGQARPLTDYAISVLGAREDQVEAARSAARLLAACRDPAVRAVLERDIIGKLGLTAHAVRELAQAAGRGRRDGESSTEGAEIDRLAQMDGWRPGDGSRPAAAAIEASSSAPTTERVWPEPDPAMFCGLAGEFVALISPHSEADPVGLLAQFLVAAGNVIGRGAYRMADGSRHGLNLFAAMVGDTAKARKGSSWSWTKRFFQLVDPRWAGERIVSGLSSGEGLIWAVRDPIEKREPVRDKGKVTGYQSVEADPGVGDKRLLVVEGEFAAVLKVLAREGNTLSTTIRDAWDRGDLRTLTKNSPAKATGAHISIVGHITIEELVRHLGETEAANGFANRFLFLCVRRSKTLPFGGNLGDDELFPLARRVGDTFTAIRRGGEFQFSEPAREAWIAVYEKLSGGRPGLLGAAVARAEAQTLRLACLYSALDASYEIRLEHLQAALALWEYCEQSAEFAFSDRLGDPVADVILAALRASPAGLSRTQIRDLFQRHRGDDEIQRALAVLRRANLANREMIATGGRPTEHWTATKATKATKVPTGLYLSSLSSHSQDPQVDGNDGQIPGHP